jgi:hypothetical protein
MQVEPKYFFAIVSLQWQSTDSGLVGTAAPTATLYP